MENKQKIIIGILLGLIVLAFMCGYMNGFIKATYIMQDKCIEGAGELFGLVVSKIDTDKIIIDIDEEVVTDLMLEYIDNYVNQYPEFVNYTINNTLGE